MQIDIMPRYEREQIVPAHLNYTIDELRLMSENNFKGVLEELRQHLLKLIEEKNHPIFGSNLTRSKIQKSLLKLNKDNKVYELFELDIPLRKNYQTDLKDGALLFNQKSSMAINQWVPEIYLVCNTDGKRLVDQFYNSDVFYNNMRALVIQDRLKYWDNDKNKKLTQLVKSGLRIVNGNKSAYNFSPYFAKWVYIEAAHRLPEDSQDYFVLDTSAGWYGRLAGCLASSNTSVLKNKTVHYYCTDVNSTIHDRFYSIIGYWKEYINPNIDFDSYKSMIPSENILDDSQFASMIGRFDMSFTSIPYFNTEQYSDDEDQSYKKFPVYDNGKDDCWKHGFLYKTIDNIFTLLKKDGEFWINVADVRCNDASYGLQYYTLESDTVEYAKSIGFRHIYTYIMIMPLMVNLRHNDDSDQKNIAMIRGKKYKYEPIFVFRKEG
jgi:hypothetical protein